jgi:alpha-D-ribose 1-methylphosphonate 5-triphosphate diphosphatase
MDWVIAGGEALLEGRIARADVALDAGRVAARPAPGARRFDASGLLVMPGLVGHPRRCA